MYHVAAAVCFARPRDVHGVQRTSCAWSVGVTGTGHMLSKLAAAARLLKVDGDEARQNDVAKRRGEAEEVLDVRQAHLGVPIAPNHLRMAWAQWTGSGRGRLVGSIGGRAAKGRVAVLRRGRSHKRAAGWRSLDGRPRDTEPGAATSVHVEDCRSPCAAGPKRHRLVRRLAAEDARMRLSASRSAALPRKRVCRPAATRRIGSGASQWQTHRGHGLV